MICDNSEKGNEREIFVYYLFIFRTLLPEIVSYRCLSVLCVLGDDDIYG